MEGGKIKLIHKNTTLAKKINIYLYIYIRLINYNGFDHGGGYQKKKILFFYYFNYWLLLLFLLITIYINSLFSEWFCPSSFVTSFGKTRVPFLPRYNHQHDRFVLVWMKHKLTNDQWRIVLTYEDPMRVQHDDA